MTIERNYQLKPTMPVRRYDTGTLHQHTPG